MGSDYGVLNVWMIHLFSILKSRVILIKAKAATRPAHLRTWV